MPTGRQATRTEIQRYINNYYGYNTRIEIDQALLKKGYNPADIDSIWLEIQARPIKLSLPQRLINLIIPRRKR